MSGGQGFIIAKRSVSLAKTYLFIGAFMTLVGLGFLSLPSLANSAPMVGTSVGAGATSGRDTAAAVPFLAVSFQALAAIMFATPVLLLFVYDKNNGVLEYLLSLGMNQRDIYRQYLKAALVLAAAIAAFDVLADMAVGLIRGVPMLTLGISGLLVTVALSAVSLASMLMMSFSTLQKQRVGSNQPLGMAIGALVVMPSYFLPLIIPSMAFWIDLILAGVIVVLALLTYSLSSRLISREKLLP
ncbi:MAG TPA: hypothetical protein VEC02_00925 [Nitrososphaerales archaeon]|nr:hypothetical protein [Nitrososphaerales archaeon]